MVAEGDAVAYRMTWRMTHLGEFMGIASTGRKIERTVIGVVRIAGGRWAELWARGDNLMRQLGAIPNTNK